MKPKLFILIGPPGSGKTHFAENFSLKHNFVHINSDQTRKKYFKNLTFTTEERVRVYEKIFQVIKNELNQNNSVLFDGNLVTNSDRHNALIYFQDFAEVAYIVFNTPKEFALNRATNRSKTEDGLYKPMHEGRAKKMHQKYELFDTSFPHVEISGLDSFDVQEKIVSSLL